MTELSFGAFAANYNPLERVDQARYKLVAEAYLYRCVALPLEANEGVIVAMLDFV
jgi:hypothetical protein